MRDLAQARWRALSARDPLERRVARLQVLSFDAIQYLLRKTATDKVRSLSDKPLSQWTEAFMHDWNPKRDFAWAMLHAERLTRLLTDVQVAEILLAQAHKHPERRELCKRWLDRAEPRDRFLLDEITTTGGRLLGELARRRNADERAAAE